MHAQRRPSGRVLWAAVGLPCPEMKTDDTNNNPPLDPLAYRAWLEQLITVTEAADLQNVHVSTFKRHNAHLIVNVGTRAPRVKRRHALGV